MATGDGRVDKQQGQTGRDVPAAAPGSLTNDLASDTDDRKALKQRLDRARERLTFYESFDRIIQENIRRSSELMIEATELRERAERATTAQAEAQAALERQRAEDRARAAALLNDLRAELDRTRSALDGIANRVATALADLPSGSANTLTPAPINQDAAGVPPTPSLRPLPTPTAPPVVTEGGSTPAGDGIADASASGDPVRDTALPATDGAPRTVEVLVHGVPAARVAISLQNHLRGLDRVTGVEAREFVEGLLRLQVTTTGALDGAALAGWADGADAGILRALPDLLEISLPGATER